ncbi:hypothetical protein ABIE69_002676 [Rhodobacteraceae bacterium MBR-64]|jgi:hypothetical protein
MNGQYAAVQAEDLPGHATLLARSGMAWLQDMWPIRPAA